MKLSRNWHNFLFGWRDGTTSYVTALIVTFIGLNQLLDGADSELEILTAYVLSYWILTGAKKFGFMEKWDKEEYVNWK